MGRKPFSIAESIANLVEYAKDKLLLSDLDAIYAQNQLMPIFGITEPEASSYSPDMPLQDKILTPIVRYTVKNKITEEEDALLFETKLMGLVTPAPSAVVAQFDAIAANEGIAAATDYLNDLSVNNNYIRMADISKNVRWTAPNPKGDLTITINLSKPEKDNKQVEREKLLPQSSYPKCMLCLECLGFNGNAKRPARETLRVVPIYLADEPWYFQYSPYVYYDQHCIAFSAVHAPMSVTPLTFKRLLDFTELFPHYFIGSNADLPIVGGSILAHEHYQGGKKVLPMFSRPARLAVFGDQFPNVKACILDWYNSVIKLTSFDRVQLEALSAKILAAWRTYNEPLCNIVSQTTAPHNTVTAIATYEEDEGYGIYMILRNNRTDSDHPDGIFHPTADMFNIKKEGIGLIEAMGTFILPGRLYNETREIIKILTGESPLNFAEISSDENPLSKHLGMIAQLTNDFGTALTEEKAEEVVVNYINNVCFKILNCTAVFKDDENGQKGFRKFLMCVGLHENQLTTL